MTMPTQARSAGPAPGVPAAARALGSRRYGYAEALPRASPACKPHCGGAGPAPRVGGQRRRPLSMGLAALWHEDSRGRAWRATPGRPPGPRAPTRWTGRRAPGSSPVPAEPATSRLTSNRPRHGPGDTDTPPRAERMSLEDEAANTLPALTRCTGGQPLARQSQLSNASRGGGCPGPGPGPDAPDTLPGGR